MTTIIVSRHPGAIEWLRSIGCHDAVATTISDDDALDNTHIIGNVPLSIAVRATMVTAIEFTGAAPRGAEYSADDMRAAGAYLRTYRVRRASSVPEEDEDGQLLAVWIDGRRISALPGEDVMDVRHRVDGCPRIDDDEA